jgi:hypothetical protein
MKKIDRFLYADEGMVLDFKNPKYALDEDHVPTQIHLYSPKIRLGMFDSPDNYIEVPKDGLEGND